MAASLVLSRRDISFLLYEWLDAADLPDRPRYREHDRETFDALLDVAEELAVDVFAPINRLLDENEPVMDADGTVQQPEQLAAALRALTETGLTASTFDEEHGGGQLPHVVAAAAGAFLQAASIGAYAYAFLAEGNAHLLVAHGTPEQIATYALPVIEGRWYGTMCLSEPHAGSSLTDITTVAVPQPDGTYRLRGTKMWISGGDHELSENIVHLVLARTPDAPPGVAGISLFIVPRYLPDANGDPGERNDVALVGLNHKMGYRGTTNTLLAFGEGAWTPAGAPGAVGEIVGAEGAGLAAMFHMMNEARIGVGSGAVALGYTGYLHALEYARTRPQGREAGAGVKDPSAPPVPIIRHPDVRRMLLAQKSYVEGGLALVLYCARLVDETHSAPSAEERHRAEALLSVLTPIAKSWPSQWCLHANDLAIQVHGGYGYARDFPVEQFYRDNRLNMIHEGTHGIQALDLLERKVIRDDGWELLAERVRDACERASALGGDLQRHAERLLGCLADVADATLVAASDPRTARAHATGYLEAAGHLVIGWLWLEQEIAAHGKEGAFYDGKRSAAEYFSTYELPLIELRLAPLRARDRTVLDLDPAVL